jgi:hypothetical protein
LPRPEIPILPEATSMAEIKLSREKKPGVFINPKMFEA